MKEKKHQDKKKIKDANPPEVPLMFEVSELVEPIIQEYLALMDEFEPFMVKELQKKDMLKIVSLIEELNKIFARLIPFSAQVVVWYKYLTPINEFHHTLKKTLTGYK